MAVAIAKYAGARFIVASDLSDSRLNIAKRWEPLLQLILQKEKKSLMLLRSWDEGFDIGLKCQDHRRLLLKC